MQVFQLLKRINQSFDSLTKIFPLTRLITWLKCQDEIERKIRGNSKKIIIRNEWFY